MRRRFRPESPLFTRSFVAICCANLLFFIGGFMLVPVLPLYLLEGLHASKSVVGGILSTYMLGSLFMRPVSGFLVDQFPRKPLFLLCAVLFVLQFGGYLMVSTLLLLAVLRALHGMCFGTLTTTAATLAVDGLPLPKPGTGSGIYGMMGSLSMALGPMIGMLVQEAASYEGVFLAAMGCAAGGLVLGLLVRSEKAERIRGGKITLDRFFLKNGGWAFVCLVLMAFVYGLLINYLSVFAWERGIEANSGYFFLFMSIGLIMSRFFAGGMIDRGHIRGLILAGKGLILGASLLFLLIPAESVFFGSALIFGLGFGMMSPSYQTMFINLAEPTRRDTANSTYLVAWDIGIGVAVLSGGLIADALSLDAAFGFSLMLLALSGALFMWQAGPHYERNRLRPGVTERSAAEEKAAERKAA